MAARDTWLLTDDRARGHAGAVDVAVVDGHVTAVGPELDHVGVEVLDGAGRVVLPGLVEPHLHLARPCSAPRSSDLVLLDAPDATTGLLDREPRTHVAALEPQRTGTPRA